MKVIMWVACDISRRIYAYTVKPEKGSVSWCSFDGYFFEIPKILFPEIKWEDPEPTKVELKIIK